MRFNRLRNFIHKLFVDSIQGSPSLNSSQLILIVVGAYFLTDIYNACFSANMLIWDWMLVDGCCIIFILLGILWYVKVPRHKSVIGFTMYIAFIISNNEMHFHLKNDFSFLIGSSLTNALSVFLFNDIMTTIIRAFLVQTCFYVYAMMNLVFRESNDYKLFNFDALLTLQSILYLTTLSSTYYIMTLRAEFLRSLSTHIKIMKNWERIMNYLELGISIEGRQSVQFRNQKYYSYFQLKSSLISTLIKDIELLKPYKYTNGGQSLQITKQLVQFDPYSNDKSSLYVISDVSSITKQEQDKYIQILIATITHELRTPLNIMSAIFNSIKDQVANLTIQTEISKALCAATLQECLINDVLDVAKINHQQLKITLATCNIRKCLVEMYSLFKFKVDEKISFQITLDDSMPTVLFIDERRYKQIVLNLLSNSCKFTSQGFIYIQAKYENGLLITSIIDSGVGISDASKHKILKQFGMVDENREINQSGSGLGLNLCRKLVECMDGEIKFESTPNIRTEFKFTVKASEVKIFANYSSLALKTDTLIVAIDDDLLNVSVIQNFSKKCDVKCKGFQHFRDVPKEVNIGLCIYFIDLHMPDISGYDCAKILVHEKKAKQSIILIALTGDEVDSVKSLCISSGFDEVITKPLKYDLFKNCVEKYCCLDR